MRKIESKIESNGLDAFDATARETVSEGLTAEKAGTRSQAARLIHDLPREATELVRELQQPLIRAIEAGLDEGAEDRDKRVAETAARALGPLANSNPEAVSNLDEIAERLLEQDNPRLRTAGAVLLTPLALHDLYEPGDEQVKHLIHHLVLSESYLDDFARRVDSMLPALTVLQAAIPAHHKRVGQIVQEGNYLPGSLGLVLEIEDVPGGIETPFAEGELSRSLDFEQYLKAPYDKSRKATTRFLATLAEHDPDVVAPYLLDLMTQLRDDDPQVVLHAGYGLAHLGEEGINQLRPLEHISLRPSRMKTHQPSLAY